MSTHGNHSNFRELITLIACSLRRFVGLVVDFVVVVSFLRFFSKLFTVLVDRERLFRVVSEDFDEVFLGERVEDTFTWVFVVPLDNEGVFAFLGDIDHSIEW